LIDNRCHYRIVKSFNFRVDVTFEKWHIVVEIEDGGFVKLPLFSENRRV
jgi:hypothetical protein